MIDFKRELFANAYKQRIPLTATIEIVSQCNFRCVHCYIDDVCRKDILLYEDVVAFGNQIIQMGCLYVVLTGGEVLLHPDFEKIYTFFIERGVCVSVFTNGSLINKGIIDLFLKYPPRVVEITMYGFGVSSYENVTKVNAFKRVKDNIILLKQSGINVLVKMFVLKQNYRDFNDICQFAQKNKIPFKYDTMIIAECDSNQRAYQISDEQVLELNDRDVVTAPKYDEDSYNYIMGTRRGKQFQCGGGRNSCWLKSNNYLRICNFLNDIEFDMQKYTVREAWDKMVDYIEEDISEKSDCSRCEYRSLCDYCPAKSSAAYGECDMKLHPAIYCKVAKTRANIQKISGRE